MEGKEHYMEKRIFKTTAHITDITDMTYWCKK